MRKEVEVKYKVEDFSIIVARMKKLGFRFARKEEYEDYYFIDKERKFIINETCLRLRKRKDKTIFTYKPKTVKADKIKSKTELETEVGFNEMKKILEVLGYILAVRFKKKSEYYKKGSITISLDQVGNKKYIEIEVLAHDTRKAKGQIVEIIKDLGLKDFEQRNYRDIMIGYNP